MSYSSNRSYLTDVVNFSNAFTCDKSIICTHSDSCNNPIGFFPIGRVN